MTAQDSSWWSPCQIPHTHLFSCFPSYPMVQAYGIANCSPKTSECFIFLVHTSPFTWNRDCVFLCLVDFKLLKEEDMAWRLLKIPGFWNLKKGQRLSEYQFDFYWHHLFLRFQSLSHKLVSRSKLKSLYLERDVSEWHAPYSKCFHCYRFVLKYSCITGLRPQFSIT